MKRLAKAAAMMLVAASTIAPLSANAASFSISVGDQSRYDNYIGSQCRSHPNWRGCNDWGRNHHHWGRNDYANWYRWNRPNLGSFAAGLFGFAIGSAIANSINDRNDSRGYSASEWRIHVQNCQNRYRSYNPNTDQFLGYDGDYHYCTL